LRRLPLEDPQYDQIAITKPMEVVTDAKNKLPELIKVVENGELVTIWRRGEPVVDIVRTTQASDHKPKFGTLRNKVIVSDPNWWKALTNEEVDAFLEGRR
jgi:antitoxin (DNA-binding transcriptional repressor) of toxin-antitoxin stability system